MFSKIVLLCAVALTCEASGYGGGGYGGGSSYGGGSYGGGRSYSSAGSFAGLGGSLGGSFGSGGGGGSSSSGTAGTIQAAIRSRHTIEYVDIDLPQDDIVPQVIQVDAGVLPLVLNFKSASSRIQVHQTHEGAEPGEIQETQSEDEPQLLRHEVTKPIIQEVREIITPFRRVIQEIQPVEEEVKTIVARGKGRRQGSSGGGGSSGGKSSLGSGSFSGSRGGGYGGSSYGSSSYSQSKSYRA